MLLLDFLGVAMWNISIVDYLFLHSLTATSAVYNLVSEEIYRIECSDLVRMRKNARIPFMCVFSAYCSTSVLTCLVSASCNQL